jgi:hypothetical protein
MNRISAPTLVLFLVSFPYVDLLLFLVSNQLTSFLRQSSGDGWCAVRCSVHLLTKSGFYPSF